LGQQGVLVHVIAPLAEEVGALWQDGTIGVAHEHFASALLRTFLGNMGRPFAPGESAPLLISATPTGQLHEIGAMMIAAAASSVGWRAIYLGASLGPQEIASAAHQKSAAVVGISLVYPGDDPAIAGELRELNRLLPGSVKLLVGGRAAAAYRPLLDELGANYCGGPLADFMELLIRIREPEADSAATPPGEKLLKSGPQRRESH
jgi:methylmalonyl-CoA mutase cobalamin-binding domain/chain